MSLQRFNLVCMKGAAIGRIRTGRLTRPLPAVCRKTDTQAALDRGSLTGRNSGKRLMQAPADHFGDVVFGRQKFFGGCAFSPPVETGDLRAVIR